MVFFFLPSIRVIMNMCRVTWIILACLCFHINLFFSLLLSNMNKIRFFLIRFLNDTAVQLFEKRVCKAYKYALFCIFTVCLEFLRAYFNLCGIILSPKKWHSSPFFRPQFDVWILTRPTCISNDIRFYFRSFRYGYYFDNMI